MYEQFTDRARKVMQLANKAAQHFDRHFIGTEHILLGLAKEDAGVANHVLLKHGMPHDILLEEVTQFIGGKPHHNLGFGLRPITETIPQTPPGRKILTDAVEIAHELGHRYVGTEHILLGLIKNPDTIASRIIKNHTTLELLKTDTLELIGILPEPTITIPDPIITYPKPKEPFTVTATLTTDTIKGLICSALEGNGSTYWAEPQSHELAPTLTIKDFISTGKFQDPTKYWHPDQIIPITPGCALIIKDKEDAEQRLHTLDLIGIQRGLQIMLTKYPKHFASILSEEDDCITADVFLQCCLFGEIIYG